VAGRMRVPRTRGVLSGLLLVLLGAWGALIPFVGPYFHYAYTPDSAWTYNTDRLWLEILPGAAVFLGGLIVLCSANRAFASLGGWLAALGGAWFVVGLPLSALSGMPHAGLPTGGNTRQVLEVLGFFYGLGVVVVFLSALALGRFAVVGIRETRAAEEEAAAERLATVDSERYEPAATAPAEEREYYTDQRTSTVESEPDPGHTEPVVGTTPAAESTRGSMPAKQTATSGWTEPSDGGADWTPPPTQHRARQEDPYNGWTASDADKPHEAPEARTSHADSTNAADGLPAAPPVDEPQEHEEGKLHRLLHRQDH
jgi:hypothetical protein